MKRIIIVAGALTLGLSMLTACGDDGVAGVGGGGDYCDLLKDAKDELDGAENGDLGDLDEAGERLEEVRDAAPDELKDDWDTMIEGFEAIIKAFEDAGITQEDMEAMQNGEIPPDLDMEAFQEAMGQLQELNSEEFQAASDNIGKHAKEECDIDLEA